MLMPANVLRPGTPSAVAPSAAVAVAKDAKYASSHEWAKVDGETATVGISDFAQVRACGATCLQTGAWQAGLPPTVPALQRWFDFKSCLPTTASPPASRNTPCLLRRASWVMLCTLSCRRWGLR